MLAQLVLLLLLAWTIVPGIVGSRYRVPPSPKLFALFFLVNAGLFTFLGWLFKAFPFFIDPRF